MLATGADAENASSALTSADGILREAIRDLN